jgi:type VI secretion system protein VasG
VLIEQFDAICANSKETQQAAAADAPAGTVPAAQGTLAQYGQDLTARAREGRLTRLSGATRRSARWWIS